MSLGVNSFEFNGVDYGDAHNIIVQDHDYPLLPKPRVWTRNYATADGAMAQGTSYEPLIITLDCVMEYGDYTEYMNELRAVADDLDDTLGDEHDLRLGWEPDKVYQARLVSEFNPRRMLTGATFRLQFLCPNPIPEDY